jgi:redox-sensitive bicupin YhaK (pirin superfamily)
MDAIRKVVLVRQSVPTLEGAGVRLKRAFGFHQVPNLDPFLLFDDFRGGKPADYEAGFPWHPHRGIETITYMLDGRVEHGDSMGNQGVIGPGDIQWMTAGSGIIHQEMPKGDQRGVMGGFQLWANLPASRKMMAPRYQEIKAAQIPEVEQPGGIRIKVVCGRLGDTVGPVRDIVIDPEYLDVQIPGGGSWSHPIKAGHAVFAYVFAGSGRFGPAPEDVLGSDGMLVVFGDGGAVAVAAGAKGVRFLLVSGSPLREPVAWGGPIVMNSQAELETAFAEYEQGTFLKHR